MMLDFLMKAFIAGMAISVVAGPLGSVMIWRRLSYFGDTLAHAMLLGVGMAFILHLPVGIGMFAVALIVMLILAKLIRLKKLPNDAILGICAHTTLALGLILTSLLPETRVNLLSYLYGDILAIQTQDLIWMVLVDSFIISVLAKIWSRLLMITLHEDLARVEGVQVAWIKGLYMLLMALLFALAVRLTGVLLITALLVIPAATARQISKTPLQMALFASILGAMSVAIGLVCSWQWDWPAGPAVVVASASLFFISLLKANK